jgi:hypothetical protein
MIYSTSMCHLLMNYLLRWGYCPFRKTERKSYSDSQCNFYIWHNGKESLLALQTKTMHFIYWYKKAATYSIWNLVSQNNVIQMSTKPEPDSHKRKICIRCDNNRIAFGPPINSGKRDIWQSPIPITKKMAIWQNTCVLLFIINRQPL